VFLPTGPASWALADGFPSLPFPALEDFHAFLASTADAREFLQFISSSSNVESLSIDVSIIPPPQELYTFLTTVRQSSFRDKLTTVLLQESEAADEDVPSHSLDAHTLSPLFQCHNLEVIWVSIRYGQEGIDNSLMKDMALAWPRLRKISLFSFYHTSRWQSNVNLEGLIHLAQYCPALESVSHEFDVSLPTTWDHPGNGIRNESLTYLNVDRSRITDPLAVAALLSDVFPNLKLKHRWHFSGAPGSDGDDPAFVEMCKCWEQVDKHLEIRKQEGSTASKRCEE
jgi:hypothetical protein